MGYGAKTLRNKAQGFKHVEVIFQLIIELVIDVCARKKTTPLQNKKK